MSATSRSRDRTSRWTLRYPRGVQLSPPSIALALVISGVLPRRQHKVRASAPTVRIVLVGDSTVTDDSGWGSGFKHLATGGVEVINTAANGRSSKSFIDEAPGRRALEEGPALPDPVRPQRRARQGA